jgi:hypothetical protein
VVSRQEKLVKRLALALCGLLALQSLSFARARAAVLADSTTLESFRLENGLEVRVRNVPGAGSIAISLAYRAGSFLESASRPDLATVLAQLQFTAAVGDVPERTLAEMPSIRPLGWAVSANPHLAVLTEVGSMERLPGLVHEVAARARGVQLDDSCLAHTLAGVRRTLGERRFGKLEPALYERLHDLAAGEDEPQVLGRVRGTALAHLTRAEADSLLKRYYVASNAALSLAGDFGSLDVRALITREFGPIAPGHAQPDPPAEKLESRSLITVMSGVSGPVAAMGILAPALEDSLHPQFFLNTLLLGGWWNHRHADAGSGLTSHFQYALLDQPELARFDFELSSPPKDLAPVFGEWNGGMEEFAGLSMAGDLRSLYRSSLQWMLGGPLDRDQRRQVGDSPALLANVASSAATRALWKGDAFWERYRVRFESAHFGATSFREYLERPEHQVLIVLTPRP